MRCHFWSFRLVKHKEFTPHGRDVGRRHFHELLVSKIFEKFSSPKTIWQYLTKLYTNLFFPLLPYFHHVFPRQLHKSWVAGLARDCMCRRRLICITVTVMCTITWDSLCQALVYQASTQTQWNTMQVLKKKEGSLNVWVICKRSEKKGKIQKKGVSTFTRKLKIHKCPYLFKENKDDLKLRKLVTKKAWEWGEDTWGPQSMYVS